MTPEDATLIRAGNNFVIEASLPSEDRVMYFHIESQTPREAHDMATGEFRKHRGVRPNIAVHTVTFARGDEAFCLRVLEAIQQATPTRKVL